jgi:hypothetical protein
MTFLPVDQVADPRHVPVVCLLAWRATRLVKFGGANRYREDRVEQCIAERVAEDTPIPAPSSLSCSGRRQALPVDA